MWVSLQVILCERIVIGEVCVITAEPVSVAVANTTLLSSSGCCFDLTGVRLDAKVAMTKIEVCPLSVGDRPAEQPTGTVNPAIHAITKAVQSRLTIRCTETSKQLFHDIRFVISVRILSK